MGALSKLLQLGGFRSPQAFQKALYWYNGSVAVRWARPPVVSDALVAKYHYERFVAAVRKAIPLPPDEGSPAKEKVGSIHIPTLFVCGEKDPYLLCARPYALRTADYVKSSYRYVKADCGHDLLSVGGPSGCTNEAVQKFVLDAITAFILNNGTASSAEL